MAVKTVLKNFAKELKNTFQAQKNIVDISADYIEKLSEEDIGGVTPEEMEEITGDLDNLTTTDKNNLVSAVNEVNDEITTINTKLTSQFATLANTLPAHTINAGIQYQWGVAPTEMTGYSPIGVVGYYTGINNTAHTVYLSRLSGGSIQFAIRNDGGADIEFTPQVTILYTKN